MRIALLFFGCGTVGGIQKPVSTKDDSPNLQISKLFLITDGLQSHDIRIQPDIQGVPFIVLRSKESLHLPGLPVIASALRDPMKGTLYISYPQRFKLQERSHRECGEYVKCGTRVMRSTSYAYSHVPKRRTLNMLYVIDVAIDTHFAHWS